MEIHEGLCSCESGLIIQITIGIIFNDFYTYFFLTYSSCLVAAIVDQIIYPELKQCFTQKIRFFFSIPILAPSHRDFSHVFQMQDSCTTYLSNSLVERVESLARAFRISEIKRLINLYYLWVNTNDQNSHIKKILYQSVPKASHSEKNQSTEHQWKKPCIMRKRPTSLHLSKRKRPFKQTAIYIKVNAISQRILEKMEDKRFENCIRAS